MRGLLAAVAAAGVMSVSAGVRVAVFPQCFDAGGWSLDVQFMDVMGSPYLLAHGIGRPVPDARASVAVPHAGKWRVKVRSRSWADGGPGAFKVSVGGRTLERTFGVSQKEWAWEDGGEVDLPAGETTLRLSDLTGFDGRCAGAVLENGDGLEPLEGALSMRDVAPAETIETELCVVGGGLPGCCAAVAAARSGVKTVLVQDRPVLGGNASREIRVWCAGEGFAQPIVAELRGCFHNMSANAFIYDDVRRRVVEDSGVDLRLCTRAFGAHKCPDGGVGSVLALDWKRNRVVEIKAKWFVDDTGDGWLGFWAGAEWRMGREARGETGESFAPEKADSDTLGASLMWTSTLANRDVSFSAPWAEPSACGIAALNGDWNWEYGIHRDMTTEGEHIRDRLLLAIYGAFSLAKKDPDNSRRILDFVPFVLGKRESRRLVGDWLFSELDVSNHTAHADAIAKCSWSVDLHYDDCKPGVDFLTTCRQPHYGRTWVPFRSIYSRNIPNLMMVGRCFSCTHVGLGSPRVMNTLAQMGVAAGYAAAVMKREGICPREVWRRGFVREIQRKMGGDWPGNPDPAHAGWKIVDDETPGVVFGKGWSSGYNHSGEQEGNRTHFAKRTAGEAVYPLPVTRAGRHALYAKVPFSPWPVDGSKGAAAFTIVSGGTVREVEHRQNIGQGTWRKVGDFDLEPGATLRIIPARSTQARIFADGFAVKELSAE